MSKMLNHSYFPVRRRVRQHVFGVGAGLVVLVALVSVFVPAAEAVGARADQASAKAPRFCRVPTAEAALALSAGRRGMDSPRGVVYLVDKSRVAPGETVYARLANFSSSIPAAFGRAFSIERRTSSGWELDPASPDGPWPKVLGRLAPGSAARCYIFKVPATHPEGRYQFSTRVQLRAGTKRVLARRHIAFEVR
jgi:hypothetical protein